MTVSDSTGDPARKVGADATALKTVLNVGAGGRNDPVPLPLLLRSPDWKEVRLDVDPATEPDVLGNLLDMSAVADASIDAIYTSHTIEHLYPNEIPVALREFRRVLRPDGFVIIICPDLQAAAQMIAEDKLMTVAYDSPGGAVTPFDMVYSHRRYTGRNNPYMAHHCGFTLTVLLATLKANGFPISAGQRRLASFDLWVLASKQTLTDAAISELAASMLTG